jgi:hypothetical protein
MRTVRAALSLRFAAVWRFYREIVVLQAAE